MTPTRLLQGAPCLAFLLLAACGGSGPQAVSACLEDLECGEGAYCLAGTCRASAAPVAGIDAPSPLLSSKVMTFQAAVTDADPGDAVASHAWTVTRVLADCDAEPEPTGGAALEVVFWCAGTYDVTLVATDRHGVPSAPATRRVEVSQSAVLPTVTASATAPSVGHRCSGEPLTCSLLTPVSISAVGSDPAGQALAYEWRARAANPRVTDAAVDFAPATTAAAAAVGISSPGTAMAGDWTFRVRVRNADGFLARDEVVVHVSNRAPAPTAAPLSIDHSHAGGVYLATGVLAGAATDPDGDPVTVTTSYVEPEDSGCTGSFDAPTALVTVTCTSATSLIGQVSRAATVTATDVNGAVGEAPVPIEIRNRPPVVRLAAAGPDLFAEHGVGPCPLSAGACYQVGGGQPFVAEDPDGDPVGEVALLTEILPAATHSAGQVNLGGAGTWRFSTPVAFPLEFREAPGGTSPFYLHGTAADPFQASSSAVAPVVVGNRPPAPATSVFTAFAHHRYVLGEYQATFELSSFVDPDGDPMELTGEPGARDCADFTRAADTLSVTCRKAYLPSTGGLPPLAAFLGTRPIVALAADAWTVPMPVTTSATIGNRAPTLVSSSGPSVQQCICDCLVPLRLEPTSAWAPRLAMQAGDGEPVAACDSLLVPDGRIRLDPKAADEDGDPLRVTYLRGDTGSTVAKTVLPKDAPELYLSVQGATSWTVTAEDGAAAGATATIAVTSVTCPGEGTSCL